MGGRQATRKTRTPPENGLEAVRAGLQGYADRGVFRGYGEKPARGGRHYFKFQWLRRDPFDLTYDPPRGALIFTNVLPNVSGRSAVGRELKKFIEARTSTALPSHRRFDRRRALPGVSTRAGTMRIHVAARRGHHAYGLNRAVNLVHEVFLHLQAYFPEYLWENYDFPEE